MDDARNPGMTLADRIEQATGANGQPVEIINIGGKSVEVDVEVAPIVSALNAAGISTVASCSGHDHRPGQIALLDGRELIIARDFGEARRISALFPLDINGQPIRARTLKEGMSE